MSKQTNIRFKNRIEGNEGKIQIFVPKTKTYTDCGDFEYHEKFKRWYWRPPQDVDLFGEYTTRAIFQELRKLNQNLDYAKKAQQSPRLQTTYKK